MGVVTLGYDGSPESEAAAAWAAEKAVREDKALCVVYAWEWSPYSLALTDAKTERRRVESLPRQAASKLAKHYRGLQVTGEHASGPPAEALIAHGRDSEMVVLGSRALSGTHGFLVGSVAQSVAARSDRPVALVRVPTLPSDASETGFSPIPLAERREVVLGIDRSDNDRLFTVAFQEAAQRGLALRVVHGWRPPGIAAVDSSLMRDERKADLIHAEEKWLDGIIQPWAEKFPEVEVTKDVHPGRPAEYLVRVSPQASLLVVGRREGRHDLVGPRLGHVTHAVMHHAQAPVIVVPEQ
ncbi:universal stress protein [Streptomyces sp. NBC_01267]|uniref:universal stress protein n=1 Tax=unclassified Streptomyces TaxID=2593676 RepID=UPI002250E99E|nr:MULTISPECIES: universal stress protein [unclassified Streptomyces]MCX4553482.1 universal stress protein [Streptomyces sp. NBC_01500]WSC18438.1 universal stress protein [Streptomyces sp. NBC_01766]WSV52478.1 universal stress protein [Streptomyces sp. NBC_01014]